MVYPHVTPKGKRSIKTTKILEPDVKLGFRKLRNYYGVTGCRWNGLGNFFVLNGKARLSATNTTASNTFGIELRKPYLVGLNGIPN